MHTADTDHVRQASHRSLRLICLRDKFASRPQHQRRGCDRCPSAPACLRRTRPTPNAISCHHMLVFLVSFFAIWLQIMLNIQHLRSAFRNLAGRWDTARVPSHRGGTGCSAIRGTSSRRRCGGPLRAAESACRLRSLRGTQPPRFSAALRIFSAMILCMLTHRTISTAYVTRLRQYRSAGARTSARPTVNALRLPRAAKPRTDTSRALIRVDFSISRQRIDAGVIPAGLARAAVETGNQTA